MADLNALNAEIAKLGAALAAFETRDLANTAQLNATIADLQAHQAAGVDTQAQIDALEAILATIPQSSGGTAPTGGTDGGSSSGSSTGTTGGATGSSDSGSSSDGSSDGSTGAPTSTGSTGAADSSSSSGSSDSSPTGASTATA